eukprot:TRINITY_DN28025_c0_g1_i2.p1 TRINITY_DN28025_c0_g1~~TRINITY_DN28025_c0_g1_i2.p1  ORF type:complete len:170 (-),score=38.70 TRINITY_DN28025_c0_g1_i2:217-726(-)
MELAWALVEASGVTIPARARCLSRFLAHSSIATVTSGVAAGQASQWLHLSCGPLIPFLFGAWIGFTGACISFYRTERDQALAYIKLYPRLMKQMLAAEFDLKAIGLRPGVKLEQWVHTGLGPVSWSVFAAQGIAGSVAEIHQSAREDIMEEYQKVDVDDADEEELRFVD